MTTSGAGVPGRQDFDFRNSDHVYDLFDASFPDRLIRAQCEIVEADTHIDLQEMLRTIQFTAGSAAYGCPQNLPPTLVVPMTTRQFVTSKEMDLFVYCFAGVFKTSRATFTHFVVILPETVFITYKRRLELRSGNFALVSTTNDLTIMSTRLFTRTTNELAQNKVHFYYVGSDRQILMVLNVEKISFTNKILTTLTHLFPFIKKELDKYAYPVPYSNAVKEFSLDPLGYRERDLSMLDATYICAVVQVIFCSAYTKQDMIEDQIFRRMTAVLATLKQEAISKAIHSNTYNSLRIEPYSAQGVALQAIGLVLNYTRQGTHNPLIKLTEVVAIRDLAIDFQITDLAIAIHEQMGLVYTGFHLSTLHFAFTAIKLIEDGSLKLFPKAREELPILKELKDKILRAPYYGLQASQPTEAQIKNFPILCSIGVFYHGRTLLEEERDEWEDYAIAGITAHVDHKADVNLAKSFAEILPNHNLASLAELAATLNLVDAEKLLLQHVNITRDDMYYYMHEHDLTCAWFVSERNRRLEQASAQYRAFIKEEAVRAFDSRSISLTSAISALDDRNDRINALQYLADERARFDKSLRNLSGTLTLFEGALHPSIDDVRVQLRTEYDNLIASIEKMALPGN